MRFASTDKAPNKTAFVISFLEKNPTANSTAVKQAWGAAGREGSVSTTLVQEASRAHLGLVGNRRARHTTSNGAASAKPKAEKKASAPKKKAARKPERRAAVHATGAAVAVAAKKAPRPSDNDRLLTEVEGDIDRLIFKLMVVSGLEDVEDALRSVRRKVVRSHKS